jgi:hypothetical protein
MALCRVQHCCTRWIKARDHSAGASEPPEVTAATASAVCGCRGRGGKEEKENSKSREERDVGSRSAGSLHVNCADAACPPPKDITREPSHVTCARTSPSSPPSLDAACCSKAKALVSPPHERAGGGALAALRGWELAGRTEAATAPVAISRGGGGGLSIGSASNTTGRTRYLTGIFTAENESWREGGWARYSMRVVSDGRGGAEGRRSRRVGTAS